MKVQRTRGMRELATLRTMSSRGVPQTREQITAELARLEHERARLQRELQIWLDNQAKTGERLRMVEERLSLLQQALQPAEERPPARVANEAPPAEQNSTDWHVVVLEY